MLRFLYCRECSPKKIVAFGSVELPASHQIEVAGVPLEHSNMGIGIAFEDEPELRSGRTPCQVISYLQSQYGSGLA